MFDIGFWELTLIGLVSLLVIGPKRLPGVVRVVGFWMGKARRTVDSVKQEFKEELYAEDLRQTLAKQSPVEEIRSVIDETHKAIENISSVNLDAPDSVDYKSNSEHDS